MLEIIDLSSLPSRNLPGYQCDFTSNKTDVVAVADYMHSHAPQGVWVFMLCWCEGYDFYKFDDGRDAQTFEDRVRNTFRVYK